MTSQEFREWAEERPDQRYELVAGEPIAMSPEGAAHALIKAKIWRALDREIRRHELSCQALSDGITVEINEGTSYQPDALVDRGSRISPDTIATPNPVVIFEVLSSSTRARDAGAKLDDYFSLPSVQQYLIVKTNKKTVIHHRRGDDGTIETRIRASGWLDLDPPGIALEIAEFYAE